MRHERTNDIVDDLERRHLELLDQTRKLHSSGKSSATDHIFGIARRLLAALVIATFAFGAILLALSNLPVPGHP